METLSSEKKKRDQCCSCLKYFRNIQDKRRIVLYTSDEVSNVKYFCGRSNIAVGDEICNYCRKKIWKDKPQPSIHQSQPMEAEDIPSTQDSSHSLSQVSTDSLGRDPSFKILTPKELIKSKEVTVFFPRVLSTHKYCFICSNITLRDLVTVPLQARLQTFVKRRLIVPFKNVCCQRHLIKNKFFENEIDQFRIQSIESVLTAEDLEKFIDTMAGSANRTLMGELGDLNFPDERLRVFTGFNWEQVLEVRDMMKSMRNSDVRSVTQALIVFLFKLRSGTSNNLIAAILGLEYSQQISSMKKSVMESFEKDILSKQFGCENHSRDNLINCCMSPVAKKLHGEDKLILILDGTYIRHEKSSNNEYQRKSYSGQKKVPLCKPFTVCTTNGYVVDMLGPYPATNNDAQILEKIMKKPHSLKNLMREGDKMIVDRGFRDVVPYLESFGFEVLMPALKGKRAQLTTEESNYTRFVTKLRWVVEAVHGIIKIKFKLLDRRLDNKMLPKTGTYMRIASFLYNKFCKRLNSDTDHIEETIEFMLSRQADENSLAREAEENHWARRRTQFKSLLSDEVLDFPELTIQNLIILFTGTYQLKQTISYLGEMLGEDDKLKMSYHKLHKNLIQVVVPSRHKSRKNYHSFVEYKPDSQGPHSIVRYCCDCPNGNNNNLAKCIFLKDKSNDLC